MAAPDGRTSRGRSRHASWAFDKTYGALGGGVVLLLWFWITNVALLLGMERDSERERSRELDAGVAERQRLDARGGRLCEQVAAVVAAGVRLVEREVEVSWTRSPWPARTR